MTSPKASVRDYRSSSYLLLHPLNPQYFHCRCVEKITGWISAMYKQITAVVQLLQYIGTHLAIICVQVYKYGTDRWTNIPAWIYFKLLCHNLNPKKTGGGGGGGPLRPPSTFRAITLQRAKLSPRHFMTFFFWVSRTFWHQICDARWYGSEVT